MSYSVRLFGVAALTCLGLGSVAQAASTSDLDFFEKRIRPVLAERCYKCHSTEASQQGKLKSELYLDSRAGVMKGGKDGPVVVPGKPDQSRLIEAVRYGNTDLQMPPKTRLPAAIVADLEKWVAMGAPDPREGAVPVPVVKKGPDMEAGKKYWAFQPVGHVEPPMVKNDSWGRTDIDRFILAKQEERELTPNKIAAKEKLIRRVYFDLIGLPPSPDELRAFLSDSSSDAYEKLVDRLLASPQYGERWGRHWLDIVRFAESGGYEFDRDRGGAYHYRDFVIRAFNRDLPYNEFIRLQLAGDKLKPDDYEAGCAAGFIVAGPYPGQITAKTAEPIRYDQLDDMVSTVGSSMLGLTVGCARCHDHKFDPILIHDYYRMAACFAKTDFTEADLDPNPEIYRKAKAEYDKAHAPLLAKWEQFKAEKMPALLDKWVADEMPGVVSSATWWNLERKTVAQMQADREAARGNGMQTGVPRSRTPKANATVFTTQTSISGITAIRVEYSVSGKPAPVPAGQNNDTAANAKAERKAKAAAARAAFPELIVTFTPAGGKPMAVKVQRMDSLSSAPVPAKKGATANKGTPAGKDTVASKDTPANKGSPAKPGVVLLEPEKEFGLAKGGTLTVSLKPTPKPVFSLSAVAVSTSAGTIDPAAARLPQAAAEIAAIVHRNQGELSAPDREQIAHWLPQVESVSAEAWRPVAQHAAKEPKPKMDAVFTAGNKNSDVYFLNRGELNKKAGIAPPGFLTVLMSTPKADEQWTGPIDAKGQPKIDRRVALADWITDTDHGAGNLLARVIVNRLWQHHLGRGIVSTPNDFGTQGDPPTYPELLDYLACRLIDGGWKLKPIQKLIVTSAVYMQEGEMISADAAIDPDNKFLWRRPTQRIEAEAIRDAMLVVSGSLDRTLYGPGTLAEDSRRRSIYFTVKRSKIVPMMQVFDAPETLQSVGLRQTTTVATQALAMMNSPFVRDCAQKLAKIVAPSRSVDLKQAIDQAFVIAYDRHATDGEIERLAQFVEHQESGYTKAKDAQQQALTDCCQVLLSSSEFVYVD